MSLSLVVSLAIMLGISLALVGVFIVVMVVWSSRRERKRQDMIRRRGPDATIQTEARPDKRTDHWNITR